MTERKNRNEFFLVSTASLGLLAISMFGAFTKRQREAILKRDDGECQFPEKHEHKGGLQVHHIIPQRYAKEVGIEDPDYPENGITLCEEAHTGKNGIHPDISRAKKSYGKNKNAYNEVFQERQEKLKNRQVYWNTTWDRLMSVIAVRNTQKKKKEGWQFPES